jgi:hypothetical protein
MKRTPDGRKGRREMATTKRRYSKEEFARRGDALVESKVRTHLTTANQDKFVATSRRVSTNSTGMR